MTTFQEVLQTKIDEEYDIIVTGGGSAGFAAALNAARHGAKTLLIEREYMLGGIMTAGLMAKIAIEPFMTGIPTEFLMRLGKEKMAIPYCRFPEPWPLHDMIEVPVDAEACKRICEDMLVEAGVEILYGTLVVGAVKEGAKVTGVIVENKSGRSVIPAKILIDASGDGDLCAYAGAEFEFGEKNDGVCSASNMLSRIAGVDLEKVIDYLEANPEEITHSDRRGNYCETVTPEFFRKCALSDDPEFVQIGNFMQTIKRIMADPSVSQWEKDTLMLRNGVHIMNTPIRDQVLVNAGRFKGLNGLDARSISKAIVECRKQNWCIFNFLKKNIPGFENSSLLETGSILGIRETRRVICDYKHTTEDFINRARFDDAILRSNDSIEFHNPNGSGIHFELYNREKGEYEEISYRSILVKDFENLMVIGRCWSAEQLALSANRCIGFCMAMGQAAGEAAAMAIQNNQTLRTIDVKALQKDVYPQKGE